MMASYRSDPYLWVHMAGLAAVPLLALICLLLLAAGDPLFPPVLELSFLAIVGIGPVLWMQLRKPFYIYALLLVAERPESLNESQRRLLPWFRSYLSRTLAIAAVVPLFLLLWKLYDLSPIASGLTPFAGQSRLIVLLLAAGIFLLVNLFAQVPLSVLRLLMVGDRQVAETPPCEFEQIPKEYTILGWPIRQILPQAWLPENRETVSSSQSPEPTTAADQSQALDAEAEAASASQFAEVKESTPVAAMADQTTLDAEDLWDQPEVVVPEAPVVQGEAPKPETDEDLGSQGQPSKSPTLFIAGENAPAEPLGVPETTDHAEGLDDGPRVDAVELPVEAEMPFGAEPAEGAQPSEPIEQTLAAGAAELTEAVVAAEEETATFPASPASIGTSADLSESIVPIEEVKLDEPVKTDKTEETGFETVLAAQDEDAGVVLPSEEHLERSWIDSEPTEAAVLQAVGQERDQSLTHLVPVVDEQPAISPHAEGDVGEAQTVLAESAKDYTPLIGPLFSPIKEADEADKSGSKSLEAEEPLNNVAGEQLDFSSDDADVTEAVVVEEFLVVEDVVVSRDESWVEDQASDALPVREEPWVEAAANELEENWIDEDSLETDEPWVEDSSQPAHHEEHDLENPSI